MTWVKKDMGWNWLVKQLVSLLPEARIWTFGYDSSWCGDFSVDTDLNEVAGKLLDAIVANVLNLDQLSITSAWQSLLMRTEPTEHTSCLYCSQLRRHRRGEGKQSFVRSCLVPMANQVLLRIVAYHGRESR